MSKPITVLQNHSDAFYIPMFVAPDIFASSWHKGEFLKRSRPLKIIDQKADNKEIRIHHPVLGKDKTTMWYYKEHNNSYYLADFRVDSNKPDQISLIDHDNR